MDERKVMEKPSWQLIPDGEKDTTLVLEDTRVRAVITGMVAVVRVTQRFRNELKDPAEIRCQFPLPHQAAIVDFQIRIGGRIIKAQMEEVESAFETYRKAESEGKHAALLEQNRPNLFQVRLANVNPGEGIIAELEYEETVGFTDGEYEFVFPMGITPRYHAPGQPAEASGMDFPTAPAGSVVGPISMYVALQPGVMITHPISPSHPLIVNQSGDQGWVIQLDGEHIPDRDFVMRYQLIEKVVTGTAQVSYSGGKYTFVAHLFPPALPDNYVPPAREFVFVLDRSGSMSGQPVLQARNALRACLRTLNPQDVFRILLFDDKLEWHADGQANPVEQDMLDQADRFLSGVQGRGGTDIIAALDAVLALPKDPERQRYIVFLTDGAVSAEERLLTGVRSRMDTGRLFTFGIGPAVNRWLLQQMAEAGRGTVEFLQLQEDIEGAIIRFGDRVAMPVLTDIEFTRSGLQSWVVYPNRLPDLYAGQPLQVCGRGQLADPGEPGALVFQGKRAGQAVEIKLALPVSADNNPSVERLWARRRIEDLERRIHQDYTRAAELRAEIISLALRFRIVTSHTTFVAVDEEVTNPSGKSTTLRVAQPLPAGLDMGGFFGSNTGLPSIPQPLSTPAPRTTRLVPKLSTTQDFSESIQEFRPSLSMDMTAKSIEMQSGEPVLAPSDTPEQTLRWLARTQRVDGSWSSDVEQTAVALLAFVRAGHTSRAGSFRTQVKRASTWLAGHPGTGWQGFAAALALRELASASRASADIRLADQAENLLPPGSTPLERLIEVLLKEKTVDPILLAGISEPAAQLRAAALSRTPQKLSKLSRQDSDPLEQLWLTLSEIS